MCSTSYLFSALQHEEFRKTVKRTVRDLTKKSHLFDTIAFRGVSGALIAPVVAYALKKKLIVVRKERGAHTQRTVEGELEGARYIILDDFVSTGDTIKAVMHEIGEYFSNYEDKVPATLVGVYLYNATKESKDNMKEHLPGIRVWVSGVNQ